MKRIMTFLAGLLLMSSFSLAHADFTDVNTVQLNRDAIDYLKTNNVIQGYADSTYKPDNRINRAEFVKIIVAAKVSSPTGANCFNDVKGDWYAQYVCTAKKMGWIEGYADGTFKPESYINFAEASKIITKAFTVKSDTTGTNNEWFAGYVKGLENAKAIPSTVQFFDKEVTRGEMAEIIWRLKVNPAGEVTSTYAEITSAYPAISSCAELKEKFDEYQSHQGYPNVYGGRGGIMMDNVALPEMAPAPMTGAPAPTAASADKGISASSSGALSTDFSHTNVQVEGVDEADIVKNDGGYIYTVKGGTVRVVKATPADDMKQVSSLDFTDQNFTPQDLYVSGNTLVVIGQSWQVYPIVYDKMAPPSIMMPRYPYNGSRTRVYIFDITDRTDIKKTRLVSYDGDYSTSRRIGNQLYMVLNDRPNYWTMGDVTDGSSLIPKIQENDKEPMPLTDCTGIRYIPGNPQPSYLIVSSIPLNDSSGSIQREVVLGAGDNVYSSSSNLYVASAQTNYSYYGDWDWNHDNTKTLLYKFSLANNGKIDFQSRGTVPGSILNQFSMDENGDHFRIATTTGSPWDDTNPSGNNVYVLDKSMNTVGSLTGLAKGEKIYSTRFLGDRLYMVTFKSIDPLFVIDLANPAVPKLLGELKIPGYSDYIHPYDATHLIGFGKDVDETIDANLVHSSGSVYYTAVKGMKVALFDVSDVANPKQMFMVTIGDRGTDSALLTDHHALLFDKDKNLLAFPITIVEKLAKEDQTCNKFRYTTCPSTCQQRCIPTSCTVDPDGTSHCSSDCEGPGSCANLDYDQYVTTFSGAMVYSLDLKNGFVERGRITHEDAAIGQYGYNWEKLISRVLYIGDYLYSVSQSYVKSHTIDTVKPVGSVSLGESSTAPSGPVPQLIQ